MRIVQTLWSRNKSLLQNNFGWLSPQYHLMAWALSSLKLKRHYEDLHLYTDTNGHAILIEYLNLPYKTATICYDNIDHYNGKFWAIAKILTYAAQDKPFIHVDGDVFIDEKFKSEIENGELVAQNREIGTLYYKKAMETVRKDLSYMPDFLDNDLKTDPISSYNAGILGGSDIDFFRKYTQEALALVDNNYQRETEKAKASMNFNVLFEQILFASIVNKENKHVICYFDEEYKDNGYLTDDIFNLSPDSRTLSYLHFIGAHKLNKYNCEFISGRLLKEYPEYYFKIVQLFKSEHRHFETKIKEIIPFSLKKEESLIKELDLGFNENAAPYFRTQNAIRLQGNSNKISYPEEIKLFVETSESEIIKEVYNYESCLSAIINQWDNISAENLCAIECSYDHYFNFFLSSKQEQLNTTLVRNSFLSIIEDSFNWSPAVKNIISESINEKHLFAEENGIVCLPRLFLKGYDEIIIDELDYNILTILETPSSLIGLLKKLEVCFTVEEARDTYAAIYELMLKKLKQLFHNKCIFIEGFSEAFTSTALN